MADYTYTYVFGSSTTIIVTATPVLVPVSGLNGVYGYAVTSVSGTFFGNPITGEYGAGATVTSGGGDNTVFPASVSSGYSSNDDGLDSYGIGFTYSYGGNTDISSFWGVVGARFDTYIPGVPGTPFPMDLTAFEVVPCYRRGSRIATPSGDIAVEDLAVGDTVICASGEQRSIAWVGHRDVDCRRHPRPAEICPIRVKTDAFGPGQPCRDLWLSPDHAIFAEGVLIPIRHLINNATIIQEPSDRVSYYHVELLSHDVILAEGLACESYLDNGTRGAFANAGSVVALYPDFSGSAYCEAVGEAAACAPLRIEGDAFARVDQTLRRRAGAKGYAVAASTPRSTVPEIISSDLADLLQPAWYLTHHPDVAAAGIDPQIHYRQFGRSEARLPCSEVDLISGLGLIDPATVVRTMADVVVAGVPVAAHFCAHGWREGRRPNAYFDAIWYRDTYAVSPDDNPLLHYLLVGEPLGWAPSQHFDPIWYRQHHKLASSVSPLAHYLQHRRSQPLSPHANFDAVTYARDHADQLRPNRDPYAHYLVTRHAA